MSAFRVQLMAVVAVLVAACSQGRSVDVETDRHVVAEAEEAVERGRDCAGELAQATGTDAAQVARALEVEPARLAPWGRAVQAPVLEEVAARFEAVRMDAAVARTLASLPEGEPARSGGAVAARARRTVEGADALCRQAARIHLTVAHAR